MADLEPVNFCIRTEHVQHSPELQVRIVTNEPQN